MLTAFLVQRYLGPAVFRVFLDLYFIVFGAFCVVLNEVGARQAAQPNKWLNRKNTSDQIPIYRWGYAVGGACFVIFGAIDLFFRLRTAL